ncbi:hypothetical protein [Actinotalea sp. K2]|uniref:hypothetical protein n=1 Tax=Actinotalea sp. K2 TaxID=2939438 RepID=UPI002017F4C9|nr:hypothetical protein [Actinotalea sp. K2]MCL3860673.1 hypothetical protein [Actinotalea sp. K2]
MALLPRLRRLIRRPVSASTVGRRRPTAVRNRDTIHEDSVRAMLSDDPNDVRAFRALAEIVRRRAAEVGHDGDPLTAPQDEVEKQRAADLAVWALAEELAGNPRAWHPLIELARLSLHEDHEGAIRRLNTAVEREPTGVALIESLVVLREGGEPVEALNLGVGHWRVRDHRPEVARHLVLAAIEAGRPMDARHHLQALDLHPDTKAVAPLKAELAQLVAQADTAASGS